MQCTCTCNGPAGYRLAQGAGTYLADRVRDAGPGRPPLLSSNEAAALEAAPAVVHFTGPPSLPPSQLLSRYGRPPSKPWAPVCLNPWAAAWYEALDATPWAGWRPAQASLEAAAAEELLRLCAQLQQAPTHGGVSADAAAAGDSASGGRLAGALTCGSFDARSFLASVAAQLQAAAEAADVRDQGVDATR